MQQTDVFDFLVGVLTPGQRPQYMIDAEIASGGGPDQAAAAAAAASALLQPSSLAAAVASVPKGRGQR